MNKEEVIEQLRELADELESGGMYLNDLNLEYGSDGYRRLCVGAQINPNKNK